MLIPQELQLSQKTLFFLKKNKMFCEKTKVFFSKHFSLNFLADLMH